MADGKVVSIYISPAAGQPVQALNKIQAVAGGGLVGDHYYRSPDDPAGRQAKGWQVTLVENEAIAHLGSVLQINLPDGVTRRNLVTHGVNLNDLVGKEFMVGDVRLVGVRLCDPCDYLEGMTYPGIKENLKNKGGLRADILVGGVIQTGDAVRPV